MRYSTQDKQQFAIFGPFFAQIFLTIGVWIYMYIRRIHFITSHKLKLDGNGRPEDFYRSMPVSVNLPSDNLKNLFEMPVLFYAITLYLFVTNQVDGSYVLAGWIYVFFRICHSLMHCTLNIIMVRFYLYVFSCFTLFYMIFRSMCVYYLS